jgi:hypothetical protein
MARKDSPTRFGGKLSSFPQYRLEKPEFFGSTRLSKDILRRACCDKWFSVQKAGLDILTAIISVIYARCKCRDQTDEVFLELLSPSALSTSLPLELDLPAYSELWSESQEYLLIRLQAMLLNRLSLTIIYLLLID